MTFNDDELAALQSDVRNIAVFFRLETDPVVRLWLGFGDIRPGVNVLDATGVEYQGFGEVVNVPAFKQLLNGSAERVDFTLSGIDGDVLAIASGDDSDQIKGKRVSIGFALMAPDWSLLGAVHWCATYAADYLAFDQQPADAVTPEVRTLTLSCGSRFTGRRRPSFSYFSDQDQQARFAGDLACHKILEYAHGFQKQWPTFS